MSLLQELRSAALNTWGDKCRELSMAADNLQEAIELFYRERDAKSLKTLNCMWARGQRLKPPVSFFSPNKSA